MERDANLLIQLMRGAQLEKAKGELLAFIELMGEYPEYSEQGKPVERQAHNDMIGIVNKCIEDLKGYM